MTGSPIKKKSVALNTGVKFDGRTVYFTTGLKNPLGGLFVKKAGGSKQKIMPSNIENKGNKNKIDTILKKHVSTPPRGKTLNPVTGRYVNSKLFEKKMTKIKAKGKAKMLSPKASPRYTGFDPNHTSRPNLSKYPNPISYKPKSPTYKQTSIRYNSEHKPPTFMPNTTKSITTNNIKSHSSKIYTPRPYAGTTLVPYESPRPRSPLSKQHKKKVTWKNEQGGALSNIREINIEGRGKKLVRPRPTSNRPYDGRPAAFKKKHMRSLSKMKAEVDGRTNIYSKMMTINKKVENNIKKEEGKIRMTQNEAKLRQLKDRLNQIKAYKITHEKNMSEAHAKLDAAKMRLNAQKKLGYGTL
jgi:hypothetical protein